MTPLVWMIGASLGSWLVVATLGGARVNPELLLGMIAPLVSASITWILVARTFAADPGRVTAVMTAAFGAKLVAFAAYVVVMLRLFAVRPVPFAVSFTSYFIALHVMEALFFKRLFTTGPRSTPHP